MRTEKKKKAGRIAARALPVLLIIILCVTVFAVSAGTDLQEASQITEVNEVTDVGWYFVKTLQKFILLATILTFIITVAMEVTKERVDVTAILMKLFWAATIGGTAYIVVDIIKAVWGSGINPAMLVGG